MPLEGIIRGICLFVISLLFALTSCNYEPEKTAFEVVSGPDPSAVTVRLNDKDDTIPLIEQRHFIYKADVGPRKILSLSVFFEDTELISDYMSDSAEFWVDGRSLPDGNYDLKIEMTTSSGTGSLADAIGVEVIQVVRHWVLVIDRSLPDAVEIKKVELKDGAVEISWEKYAKHNFQRYELTRDCYNEYSGQYDGCATTYMIVTDQDVTSMVDSTYNGGKVEYSMKVYGYNRYGPVTNKKAYFPYDPALSVTWVGGVNFRATWHRTPFYRFFDSYEVSATGALSAEIGDISDTVTELTTKVKFGEVGYCGFKVRSGRDSVRSEAYVVAPIFIGDKFPAFDPMNILYDQTTKCYLLGRSDTLLRVDGSTLEVKAMRTGIWHFAISKDASKLYVSSGTKLTKIDPMSLNDISSNDLNDLLPGKGAIGAISAGNNDLVLVYTTMGYHALLKMPDFVIVQQTHESDPVAISPENDYILQNDRLWQWDGSTLVDAGSVDESFQGAVFTDGDQLITNYVEEFQILSIPDLSVQKEVDAGTYSYEASLVYDQATQFVGVLSLDDQHFNNNYLIYSLSDELPRYVIPIHSNNVVFINNSLICSDGFRLPSSFF